jgi:hypothetical protein
MTDRERLLDELRPVAFQIAGLTVHARTALATAH